MMYKVLETPQGSILYRVDVKDKFRNVDAIVMDVDGTLIDISNSYNKAICKTVNFFLKILINMSIPETVIMEAIQRLRLTGGFNNDWDTTYTIIMGVLSELSTDDLAKIANTLDEKGLSRRPIVTVKTMNFYGGMSNVLKSADSRGLQSIEEWLQSLPEVKYKHLMKIRRFLGYPDMLDRSLLASVFDEFYYGSEIYSRLTGRQPLLRSENGLIKNEKVIVRKDVLAFLKDKTKGKLGLTTGRSRIATEIVLGGFLKEFFKPEALIFIEDLLRKSKSQQIDPSSISKPNPYTLKCCLEALKPYRLATYLGDSIEDALMAWRANQEGEELIFIGVYRYTLDPESVIKTFMNLRVSAIIPTVNELKTLLEGVL